jgi:hypothetical protein
LQHETNKTGMKKLFYLLAFLFVCSHAKSQKDSTPVKSKYPKYHYLLYLPQQYDSDDARHWPLIIYLHGKSACGTDLGKVKRYGLPFFTDRGMSLDAIAVSPQCPEGKNWTSENWLNPILKELTTKYHIDTTRIYLTGMSLGGFGTWDLAIKYPHRFAAIAPLCGGGNPRLVGAIKEVPVWAFHGDHDQLVPINRSKEMIEALRKCGGYPKFTILKGFPHDIHRMYGDPNLYKWMLQYRLNVAMNPEEKQMAVTDTAGTLPGIPFKRIAVTKKVQPEVITNEPQMLPVAENKIKSKTTRKKAKVLVAKKETEKNSHQNTGLSQQQPVKLKTASNEQTDTLKGKGFLLVF